MSASPARRLSVGLVTPGFSASEQDWCVPALLDLVRVLGAHVDLRVLALRYPGTVGTYPVYGAEVHALGAGQAQGARARVALAGRGLGMLLRRHRQRPFDLLHALWAHEPGALAVVAGRLLRIPVVVSVLGGELVHLPDIGYGGGASRLNARLIALALRHATRITVGSGVGGLGTLAGEHGLWDERWSVWPLGVDTRRFCPGLPGAGAPSLDGAPALLSVAALTPVKDPEMLLRAFAQALVQRPAARLHMVGEGALRTRLEVCARDLGVGQAVRFYGALSHDRLVDFYRQADALVVSSRFESQSMVVLEAAACGCPTVGTAVGLLPEVFPDGLVAPRDAHALAQRLITIVAGRAAAGQGVSLARSVRERHGVDIAVDTLRGLYRQVAAA